MLKIVIQTIPHHQQRYNTVGDYYFDAGRNCEQIKISEMKNWKYEFLVAVHELIEDFLCKHRGVQEGEITAFDVQYESKRKQGDESEPGDDPSAPYYKEHQFATYVEKLLAVELGVNWDEYDAQVKSL